MALKKQTAQNQESRVENIPLSKIHISKLNPRKSFDDASIKELAESMAGPAGHSSKNSTGGPGQQK